MTVIRFSLIILAAASVCFASTSCTPEEIADENTKKLSKANNILALNVYRQLSSQSSENIFFSPLSLSTAFGMLYYGTKGKTAKELRHALGYEAADIPDELVHQTFQHYLTQTLPSQDHEAYVLNSANSILLDKSLDSFPSYKEDVQDLYQAAVKDVDFTLENREIVQKVNDWVKDKTNGKIDKLLDELDPSTLLVLLNAVYFKGTWKSKFDARKTHPQKFYNYGLPSKVKDVPMMRLTERFLYTSNHEHKVEAIEMPYKGENISMLVLLPHERDGLEVLEKSLSIAKLHTIRYELDKTKVFLTLPKFKVEYSREMSGDFQGLGAKSIFSPGADFSGITPDKNVYVSQVLHKAVVEVNEEGSEAAAVTGVISNRMRPIFDNPPKMVVDHPFLFAIIDKRNDMILFAGRVTNL